MTYFPGSVPAVTLMAEKTARIFIGAAALGSPTALSPQMSRGSIHVLTNTITNAC